MKKRLILVITILLSGMMLTGCGHQNATETTENSYTVAEREQITKDFINMIEMNPELKHLIEESIDLAAVNNPDPNDCPGC